ncbi:helix-turn-helix transcriptional regulator [Rhizobium sp. A37_96]
MKAMEPEESCPLSGSVKVMQRFVLGRRDERFAISRAQPSHAVELKLSSFDASSERESGGMLVCVHDGEAKLFGAAGCWTLPSGHMVFIPADRSYRLAATGPVELTLVKFTGAEAVWHHPGCWAVAMPALAVEMASFARRWGVDRDPADQVANDFFRTMGHLFAIWFDTRRKMWTPFGNGPDMERVIEFARDHLETASLTDAAAAVAMSERTLRRRFKDELGISWREFINELRMSEAMRLLRQGNISVTETAYAVGFNSIGAFTVAFTSYTGSTPGSFVRRHTKAGRISGRDVHDGQGTAPLSLHGEERRRQHA